MSFRARLVLAAAYLVTAVVLALEIPLALNIKRRAEADFRASVFGQAALLSARIADGVASASSRPAAPVPSRLAAVVGQSGEPGQRVVVTDDRGPSAGRQRGCSDHP